MNNLTIPAYSEQSAQAVKERLDSLAKVPGSLGKLEELAIRLAGITGGHAHPSPKNPWFCSLPTMTSPSRA